MTQEKQLRCIPLWDDCQQRMISYVPRGKSADDNQIEQWSIGCLLREFDMQQWTHTVWSSAKIRDQFSTMGTQDQLVLQYAVRQSCATENKLALTDMPLPLTGYGVIAKEIVPAGSRLIYSSALLSEEAVHRDCYAVSLYSQDAVFTAREYGNISKFFGHAFTVASLNEEVGFYSEETILNVATANFTASGLKTTVGSFPQLVANRDILPNELLLWDYQLDHFNALNITPSLFHKDTHTVIDPALFYWKNITIRIQIGTCFVTIPVKDLIRYNSPCFIQKSLPELSYHVYIDSEYFVDLFIERPHLLQKIRFCLDLSTEESKYIKRLQSDDSLELILLNTANTILDGVARLTSLDRTCLEIKHDGVRRPYTKSKQLCVRIKGSAEYIQSIKKRFESNGLPVVGPIQIAVESSTSTDTAHAIFIEENRLFSAISSTVSLSSVAPVAAGDLRNFSIFKPEVTEEGVVSTDSIKTSVMSRSVSSS